MGDLYRTLWDLHGIYIGLYGIERGSILFSLILCVSCGGIGRSSFGLIIKRGDFGVI